ncbi:MAG: class I SAM-dependent methyltransferase [Chloroflexales bacterium]
MPPDYTTLHAPHLALLRAALEAASPAGARAAVDLACGNGDKTAWLTAMCAPGAVVLGLDCDRCALQQAYREAHGSVWLAADAHALPLRPGTVDLLWCVAALSLFTDQKQALAEAWRALPPGGTLVVATATERWVRLRHWATHHITTLAPPADDLGADLRATLIAVGPGEVTLTAYLLDPPGLTPVAARLPLADFAPAPPLAISEPEPLPVLLVGVLRRTTAKR